MATQARSEAQVNKLWDRCLTSVLVNTGVGAGVGIVLSAFLFKRKSWPVVFSTGIGLGLAQAQCQFDFAHPELIKERLVKTRVAPSAASPATPVTPAEAVVVEAIRETISED